MTQRTLLCTPPGSTAGLAVSILKSFAAPGPAIAEDPELLREQVNGTATALLGLLGIQADAVQSRQHILIATILASAWKQGRDLDLAGLIQSVQSPPMSRIGVLDLESFYPAKERFALSMSLNNLLASPGFEAWLEGEPLDIAGLLHTPQGKPRVSIFSVSHLGDAERMFFVSLLLNQTLGWMRAQSGTTSLRAILYMSVAEIEFSLGLPDPRATGSIAAALHWERWKPLCRWRLRLGWGCWPEPASMRRCSPLVYCSASTG